MDKETIKGEIAWIKGKSHSLETIADLYNHAIKSQL